MVVSQLMNLNVDEIDPSDDNPRLVFPQEQLDKLAQSIDKEGILVPIVVFKNGERYKLVDGERRLRCSLDLGLPTVPAIVVPHVDDTQELVQMFNIHMVREPWKDMPTAWALEKLIVAKPRLSDRELCTLTGLTPERLQRFRHALELPEPYQRYIHEDRIPLNFFWELKTNVIDPLARTRPELLDELGSDHVVAQFVEKSLNNVITNVVALRKVRPIIAAASEEEAAGRDPEPFDSAIRLLVNDGPTTIEEAYESTVEVFIEVDKLERRSSALIRAIERALEKTHTPEERAEIAKVVGNLTDALARLMENS